MEMNVRGQVTVNGVTFKNLTTTYAREQLATWWTGGTVTPPSYIAIGYGTVAASVGDTALYNEIYRKSAVSRLARATYYARIATTFTTHEPPVPPGSASVNIKEMGLFDGGTVTINNNWFETWTPGTPASPNSWLWSGGTPGSISGTASVYEGSAACRFSGTAANAQLYQNASFDSSWVSQQFTFRVAVKAGSASLARAFIYDGYTTTYSGYNSGTASYEVLSAQKTLSGTANALRVGVELAAAGTADVDWANAVKNGNCWARAAVNVTKETNDPVTAIWEVYSEEQDEEGSMPYVPYNNEEISAGTSSYGSLDPTKYQPTGEAPAQKAVLTIESNQLRYWVHSGTPTASSGHVLDPGDVLTLEGATTISRMKYIGVGGTATVKVTYER
jgi:hypothetical protein